MEDKLIIGKIIKVDEKGWGFITTKEVPFTRIFFHWTALMQDTLNFKQLQTNMKVEFKAQQIPEKGWRALKVRVIEQDNNNDGSNSSAMPTLHGDEPPAA